MILEQAYRQGLPIPDRIKNAPDLELGLELYYGAFFDLTSCRNALHNTEGPVPWDKVRLWAYENELDDEQTGDLHFYLGMMDEAYLKFKAKKMAAANKPPPKRGRGKK